MASDSVLVIGDIITDIIVNTHGPIAWGSDTHAGIKPLPGGSGANQAAWLGVFGIPTMFVARTNANDIGHCEAELRDFGVEAILAADAEKPTGMLVTLITEGGERSFLTDRGANGNLCRGDLPDGLLDRISMLHISGYALFDPMPRAAVLDFAAKARRMGVQVTVDPASVGFLREVGADAFLAWTKGMHICFPNSDEAQLLTGSADPEAQLRALGANYDLVVIKRGMAGAVAGNRADERWTMAAKPVAVVDTIGAGDAFFAGFTSAYFRGHSMAACLAEAVETGTRSTTIAGGRPPRPDHRSHP